MKWVYIKGCDDADRPNTRANAREISSNQKLIAPNNWKNGIEIQGLKMTLQYLRCFGQSIPELSIKYNKSKSKRYQHVHHHINKYCAETLTKITFWVKSNIPIKNFVKPFVNVENVCVYFGDLGNQLPSFVVWFPNVRELYLEHISYDHRFINASFQHLGHLLYSEEDCNGSTINGVNTLLALNQHLETLNISIPERQQVTMTILLDTIKNNSIDF